MAHAQQRHHRPIPTTHRPDGRLQEERRQTDLRQHNRRRWRRHLWQRRRQRLRENVNRLLPSRCFRRRRYIRHPTLTPITALRPIASNTRSMHSSFVTTSLPTATPAVLVQNISHTLQTNIHVEPLPYRSRSIRETGVRSLGEKFKNPLYV